MSARDYLLLDLNEEVYMGTNDYPLIGGWTADQWIEYAEESESSEQEAAYGIARWLNAYDYE